VIVRTSQTAADAPPRSSQDVRAQLTDLAKVKAITSAYGTPDFASRLGMQGVLGHEEELLEELRAAEMVESGSTGELVFDGDPVHDQLIQASFLGAMLSKVQQLFNAVAQAVTSVPTARAPVPRDIVAENRLLIAGWHPSSFAVRFRLPTKELLGQLLEPESEAVLGRLMKLLGEQAPSQETIELVSHARVLKHYYEFLDLIAKQGAVVRMRTRQQPYGVVLTAQRARDRVDWLDLLTLKEEVLNVTGTLVGGSVETGRFELKVGDEVYRGRVSDAARGRMKTTTFGANVHAAVRATTVTHEEAPTEPSTSYYLVALEPG
jgi:hypothetical protein